MRSIKPGRGPSMMGGVGSVVAIVFGVFWTIVAFSITSSFGAPGVFKIFPFFGIIFIIVGIINAVYSFSNATRKNRLSLFDITEGNEEPDPLNELFNKQNNVGPGMDNTTSSTEVSYCPYCGTKEQSDFEYCIKCGKKLP